MYLNPLYIKYVIWVDEPLHKTSTVAILSNVGLFLIFERQNKSKNYVPGLTNIINLFLQLFNVFFSLVRDIIAS